MTSYGAYLDLARGLLLSSVRDRAILLDNHGPTSVAIAQTRPAVILAELGLGVGQKELWES